MIQWIEDVDFYTEVNILISAYALEFFPARCYSKDYLMLEFHYYLGLLISSVLTNKLFFSLLFLQEQQKNIYVRDLSKITDARHTSHRHHKNGVVAVG